jgi:hypothetical protein
MSDDPKSVGDILDRLHEVGEKNDRVTLGEMTEAFGSRSYGPFLLVPALLEESPVGAIPGVPTAIAIVIALFAVQMLFGRKQMWLPGFIARRGLSAEKLKKASDRLRPVARFMDRWFHGRLTWMTEGPAVRIAAAATLLLCLAVPPLEVLPFASSAPMLAIAAFGLALLVRDGVLMIAASVLALAAVGIGIGWLGSGSRTGG